MTRVLLSLLAGILALALGGKAASAAEIKLLTAGAMRAVVVALLPEFEKQTGHKVEIDNATAGTLKKRIEGGKRSMSPSSPQRSSTISPAQARSSPAAASTSPRSAWAWR
jgi:spermidine/putrescine-binding protein